MKMYYRVCHHCKWVQTLIVRTNVVCPRTQYTKEGELTVASICWSPMIRLRPTIFWKFGIKAPLKKVRNLSLSQRRGPRRRLEWLKLLSICLKTLIGASSEQQQLERGLWGFFLATRIFWRRWKGLCQPEVGAWFLHVRFKDSRINTWIATRSREWSRWPAYSSRRSADWLHCHWFQTFCYFGKYFGTTFFLDYYRLSGTILNIWQGVEKKIK